MDFLEQLQVRQPKFKTTFAILLRTPSRLNLSSDFYSLSITFLSTESEQKYSPPIVNRGPTGASKTDQNV